METYREPSADTGAPAGGESALFHTISKLSCFLGGVFLVVILLAILVHILSRLFGLGFAGGDEIARYAMAFSGFFGFAYAFAEKAQVRADFVLNMLRKKTRRTWEIFLSLLLGGGILVLIYYWGKMTYASYQFKSIISGYLPIQAWIIQVVLLAGLLIFFGQIILYIVALARVEQAVETESESAL